MKHSLIYILLTVISVFVVSCGAGNDTPLEAKINFNGFLSNFRGGSIEIKIYDDIKDSCEKILSEGTDLSAEHTLSIKIPYDGDIMLSAEKIYVSPGKKTVYAELKDKNGVKKGHDCQVAVKCSVSGKDSFSEKDYEIKAGDKACVYMDMKLLP